MQASMWVLCFYIVLGGVVTAVGGYLAYKMFQYSEKEKNQE